MDFGADMEMCPLEGTDDTSADHAVVFVVCIWQHDDVLGNAAPGNSSGIRRQTGTD